jgi:uncharacterized protein YkwD
MLPVLLALAVAGCGERSAAKPVVAPVDASQEAAAPEVPATPSTTTTTTVPATTTTTAPPAPPPTVVTARRATAPAPAPLPVVTPDVDGEARALQLVNAERAQAGVAPLLLNTTARSVARSWSIHMATAGLAHNPDLSADLNRAGLRGWASCGENVGYSDDVDGAHVLFMASPSHRANILDPRFSQAGIGVVHSAGRVWVTMDLIAY